MKKKLLFILTLIALLTGCSMRMNIGLKIDKDKKISAQLIQAMDNEMIDTMIKYGSLNDSEDNEEDSQNEVIITDEMRWEYLKSSITEQNEDENVKIEKYEQDNYKGYIILKEINSIDEIATETEEERVNVNDDEFTNKKLFIKKGNVYKSNIVIKKDNQYSNVQQYEAAGAIFDLKFIITLPNKSISNNADNVSSDGLTLSWNLANFEGEEKNVDFEFEFEKNNPTNETKSNLMVYLGIGGLALIIIVIIILVLKKGSNKKVNNETYNNESENKNDVINTELTDSKSINEVENKTAKFCPNCGTPVNSHYCVNCGTKID